MSDNTAVLDKIAKLLAMQEARGATEAEAQIAAEHVQRLLQAHNLTLSQVEQHAGATTTPGVRRTRNEVQVVADPLMQWRVELVEGVAETNFCLARVQSYFDCDRNRRRRRVQVIGREVNVQATLMTTEYLVAACMRELATAGYALTQGGNYAKDASYFLSGTATRIVERLVERRAEREAESRAATQPAGNGTHRELVLSDVYGSELDLNNDFLNNYPAGTTAANRRKVEGQRQKQEAEHERLVAEGMDSDEAWYRAFGYGEAQARAAAARWKRSNRRRGGRGGSAQNWSRSNRAHYLKVNSRAYRDGREAGGRIGLDEQVGGASRRQITSK